MQRGEDVSAPMHATAQKPGRRPKKRAIPRYSKAVVRWLIFCFPAGLLMMWSDRCRWSRQTKSLISCGIAGALIAVLLPITLPPQRAAGGVQLVSAQPVIAIQGPCQDPEDVGAFEIDIPASIKPPSVVVEPTPEPPAINVYCNTGGKHYHTSKCRYATKKSAYLSLGTALDKGFTPCKDCNPPAEYPPA